MSEIVVRINKEIWDVLYSHLFQGELEQGAFLMTRSAIQPQRVTIDAVEFHLIQPEGWTEQLEIYLEMTDEERGKIMQEARRGGYGVVDIHSHPGSGNDVWFSPSDVRGITDFAAYSKWKLPGQPYVAMVWGEESFDAVAWHGNFEAPQPVSRLELYSQNFAVENLTPTQSWFAPIRGLNRKELSPTRREYVR